MEALELLQSRMSVRADELTDPAPGDAELETLIGAALTAPDHGNLQPWRFIAIRGEARARLGDVFVDAALRRDPSLTDQAVEKLRSKPLRAPLIIVVAAAIDPENQKIPVIEQLHSVAAAAQQLQLAANALGYGSIWLTGESAHDPAVAEALGLDFDDRVVGFIHVGSVSSEVRPPPRPEPARFLREWTEPLQLETL